MWVDKWMLPFDGRRENGVEAGKGITDSFEKNLRQGARGDTGRPFGSFCP